MADFPRRAADGILAPVQFGRLAACLAVSGLLHALAFAVDWSSIGPFRLLGTTARPANWRDSRRIDAIIVAAVRPPVEAAPVRPQPPEPPVSAPAPRSSVPAPEKPPLRDQMAPLPAQQPAPAAEAPVTESPAPAGEPVRSMPLPTYFPADALTRQPELVGDIDETLREPLDSGFGGRVRIRLYLDQAGKPERATVLESTLPIEIEGLIVRTFFTAQYRPGEIDGRPVMSEMTMEVDLSSTTELHVPKPPPAAPARGGAAPAN